MKKKLLNAFLLLLCAFAVTIVSNKSFAQITTQTQWALQLGSTAAETATGIAHDKNGNSYIIGSIKGDVNIILSDDTESNLVNTGISDIFIAKVNSSGKYVWVKVIGGTGEDIGQRIKVDAEGNLIAIGQFSGTVDFNAGGSTPTNLSSAGNTDVFILKLTADGELIWVKALGGSGVDYAYGLDIDDTGSIYVGGRYQSTVDFDPGVGELELTANSGTNDAYVMKLNSSGDLVWAKSFGGTGWDVVNSLAVDASGNVYLTGRYSLTANFNPDGEAPVHSFTANFEDAFILKLDATGAFVWNRTFSSTTANQRVWGHDIAVDKTGNVYTTGYFYGTATFNPTGPTVTAGNLNNDIYILKINPTGDLLWSKAIGGSSDDRGEGLALDGNGDVYVTGRFAQNNVSFGDGLMLSVSGQYDVFLLKINKNGVSQWAERLGGTTAELGVTAGTDSGFAISVDLSGNVYTTGTFGNGAAFDFPAKTIKLTTKGGNDAFIHKLAQNGFTLPVELSKFYIQKQIGGNELVWETLSEKDNSHFEIEKSVTGVSFETIKSMNGKGNSQSLSHYSYLDTDINYPVIYYRLKQVDFNGTATYSTIQVVKNQFYKDLDYSIYPNPVANKLTIKSSNTFENAVLKLSNATGKIVLERNGIQGQEIMLDLSALPKGLYIVEVSNGENRMIRKLLKH